MKKTWMLALLSACFSFNIQAQDAAAIGSLVESQGKVFSNEQGMTARRELKKGDLIPLHNHAGHEIFFSVLQGEVSIKLDERETHDLQAGQVLRFNGDFTISGVAQSDAIIFVSLIKR